MTTSIDARDRDVQSAFEKVCALARGKTIDSLEQVESSMWTAMLVLGRALVALYLARVVALPRSTDYVHDGAKFVLAETATSEIGTRFSKVVFERPVGRRVGWRRSTCDRPIDRALGLCGFSLATVMSVTRLCAQLAFANARATFAQFCEWSRELRNRSGADKVSTVLSTAYASIAKTAPGNKAKREKLLDVHTHIGKHRHRMGYHELRPDDLDTATGIIEGAIRNLVRMRLDGPGMRWSRGRSEWVLHLRCILLNGQWDDFAAHLAHRGRLQLADTPTPTRSHDAAKRAV